jgi:glycosyltransferase involved in cell wall biosynthesis
MPECVLWLAGEGPAREDLQNLAQKLGIAARVKFLGWRTDRGALLKAADICVLPSRYEPFGTVILEAWESRVPFIACASDGPRAHIRHGENGMITPIDDAAALGHAIKQVLQNKDLRDRIVAQGYAEYQADFTREAVTRQWMGFYKKIQAP